MKRVSGAFLILVGMILVQLKEVQVFSVPACCVPDVCVALMGPLSFFMITFLPVVILNQYITEKDFRYQFVIRSVSWRSVLKRQLLRSIIASAMISLVFLAVVAIYCLARKIPLYNWDSYSSIFFLRTNRLLGVSAWNVYIYVLVCIVLRCTILQNILLLFLWGCRYKVLGVLACLCIVFDEVARPDKVICRLIPFNYNIWCRTEDRLRLVIQLAVYVCISAVIYKLILNRKELLRCE